MWRCGVCGYVWDDDEPPDECPKCGAAKAKYSQIDEKAAEVIDNARYTNALHMQLHQLLEEVGALAEDGIEEDLDPSCVKIFTRALEMSDVLQQSIKAELQSHMNKGKWG
jgi:predicted  nucleic acid-binding Zn-ribbon protein